MRLGAGGMVQPSEEFPRTIALHKNKLTPKQGSLHHPQKYPAERETHWAEAGLVISLVGSGISGCGGSQ